MSFSICEPIKILSIPYKIVLTCALLHSETSRPYKENGKKFIN